MIYYVIRGVPTSAAARLAISVVVGVIVGLLVGLLWSPLLGVLFGIAAMGRGVRPGRIRRALADDARQHPRRRAK